MSCNPIVKLTAEGSEVDRFQFQEQQWDPNEGTAGGWTNYTDGVGHEELGEALDTTALAAVGDIVELKPVLDTNNKRQWIVGPRGGTPLHHIRVESVSAGEYTYTEMEPVVGTSYAEKKDKDGNPITGVAYERNGWNIMWGDGNGLDVPFIANATRHTNESTGEKFMLFTMPMPPIPTNYQGVFRSKDGRLVADYVRAHSGSGT